MKAILKREEKAYWGDLTGVSGNLTGVRGNLSEVTGDLDNCEITDEERSHGIDINDLICK